ncbi:transglutaminaseTgpA domain-containing protein [Streptomyces litchfieldiae]|uniref:TransglutaminaseTgpA domain-containing protein n=1 Tax=Streptomyces litchfieldiae TaxID=3075543 RepID=A0ABU2MY31_9ACTN|nr:transglutaminaseTgpA domain-containing protein [Streptomyces sp. DSM 44938]MDT0346530.1 transglutaminaseTgpA domain-containing protein [Streptomyces sp. DSM 44938]
MDGRIRIACAAWLATLAAAGALLPLIDGSDWLVQAAILLAAQTGVGMLLRWRGVAGAITAAAQAVVSLLLLTLVCVPEYATGGLLPGPAAFDQFGRLLTTGAEDISHYVAPAPATDGIRLMVFGGVLIIGLLVDMLAVPLRSAASAGLPLLALYSVAAGVAQEDSGWPYFLCAAAGYLVLLLAEGRDRVGKWGRFLAGPGRGRQLTANDGALAGGPRARAGRRIGAVTLGVAVLAPALLPSLGEGLLDLEENGGSGRGGPGRINAVNPVVALQDQLTRPANETVLTYETNSPAPSEMYLRLVALDEFTGEEWRSSGWYEDRVPEAPWPVPGLTAGVPTTTVTTTITAEDNYAQSSLPVPYPARSIETTGDDWLFDRGSGTLVSDDPELTSRGRTYEVEHLLVAPTTDQLAGAPDPPAELQEYYTRVPGNLPSQVLSTALEVTADATNDYERAVALQDWFTQEGGFRYETAVTSGSGIDAIVNFLNQKEGFCVHFAFTMATMARTLDIPAQVAVGFTPGSRQASGSYEVGTHNAHAWPELYFEGVGWVRFEPTPGQGSVPEYSHEETPAQPDQDRPGEPSEEASPSRPEPSASSSAPDRCDPAADGTCGNQPRTPESDDDEAGLPVWPLIWTGGGLLAVLALAAPMLWRTRVRARRLAPDAGPLAAWRELNDTAWDHGIAPQPWETPRQLAHRVVRVAELPEEPAAAVLRVATAVETELYAPHGTPPDRRLVHDVRAAAAGLRAGAGRWERLRALLLPRSAIRVMHGLSERRLAARARARAGVARALARRPWRRA